MPRTCLLSLLLLSCCVLDVVAAELTGKVVRIADGDTLTVLVDDRQHKVRLVEIDAPERGQPFGQRARQALAELTHDKTVTVRFEERDRYGRILGEVMVDGISANRTLVASGYAWAYRHYLKDKEYLALEQQARVQERGLWAHSDPVPPWQWRRGMRTPSGDSKPAELRPDAAKPIECNAIKRCAEMRSCEEALIQLQQCGAKGIDGDNDGIPCEKLCRQ